jgi:hypothetical protein
MCEISVRKLAAGSAKPAAILEACANEGRGIIEMQSRRDFLKLEQTSTDLPDWYRSHGSTHELDIPLFAYDAKGLPPESYFEHNVGLTRWLYRA